MDTCPAHRKDKGRAVYAYVYTYIHTYIYTYVYSRIHTYIHAYIHIYIYVHTYTRTRVYRHISLPAMYAGRTGALPRVCACELAGSVAGVDVKEGGVVVALFLGSEMEAKKMALCVLKECNSAAAEYIVRSSSCSTCSICRCECVRVCVVLSVCVWGG